MTFISARTAVRVEVVLRDGIIRNVFGYDIKIIMKMHCIDKWRRELVNATKWG
jgi:hypothetical protein